MQKSPQALKPADFFALWILYVDLCSAAEAEGHPPIGVNGHLMLFVMTRSISPARQLASIR